MQQSINLQNLQNEFVETAGLMPFFGAELEFYVDGKLDKEQICKQIQQLGIKIEQIVDEDGDGQYEAKFAVFDNAQDLADDILCFKDILNEPGANLLALTTPSCQKNNQEDTKMWYEPGGSHRAVDFNPIPHKNQPGSALHIHIHLEDKNGNNVFMKPDGGEDESIYLQYAVAGLLDNMQEASKRILTSSEDLERIKNTFHAPKTISWGGNNRTVAIRLPTTTKEPEKRRIEYRLASANCAPEVLLESLILGMKKGILDKNIPNFAKIYGNANDEQYGLLAIF